MLFGLQLPRRVSNTSQKSSTQGVFHKSILMNLEKSARLGFWLKSRAKSSHCLICSFSDHSAWGRAHKKIGQKINLPLGLGPSISPPPSNGIFHIFYSIDFFCN